MTAISAIREDLAYILTLIQNTIATFAAHLTAGSHVPIGAIVMWGGLLANIPTHYQLCDGTNGTPDLRSRMVRGNRAGVDPTGPFGSDTHTHAVHTAHSNHVVTQPSDHAAHTVTQPNNHVVTQASAHSDHDSQGAHSHDSHTSANAVFVGVTQQFLTGPATHTSQGAHTHNAHSAHVGAAVDAHSGTSVSAHSVHSGTAVDAHTAHSAHDSPSNLPVYYELAFIQRMT